MKSFSYLRRVFAATAIILGLLPGGDAVAQTSGTLLLSVPHPDPQPGDLYGRNMAITKQGHILTGGQLRKEGSFTWAGIAYLMDGQTGQRIFTLTHPEPAENDRFGAFMTATDNYLVVPAMYKDDGAVLNSGRVYVFSAATGQHVRTIHNPSPGGDDQFGYGISSFGDTLLIGSRGDDTAGPDAGAVYVYSAATGALLNTILNPSPTSGDLFGFSVQAVSHNRVLVGAPIADHTAENGGTAFLLDTWTGQLLHTLHNPDPIPAALYGYTLAARDNDLLVGALPANLAVYNFDATSGLLKNRIPNPDPHLGGTFGVVQFVGTDILVGNPACTINGVENAGRAYLFDSTGYLLRTFDSPIPTQKARFGLSFGNQLGNWVIGAGDAEVNGVPGAGTLFIYKGRFGFASAENWNLYE